MQNNPLKNQTMKTKTLHSRASSVSFSAQKREAIQRVAPFMMTCMALFTMNPIYETIHGKLGKITMFKHNTRQVMKVCRKPFNPQSSYQTGVRATFKIFSQSWKSLSAGNITAWNTAAALYEHKDKNGVGYKSSGFQYYKSVNEEFYNFGGSSPVASPPTRVAATNHGNIASPIFTGGATQTMVLDIPAISASDALQLWATIGLSPGITNVGKKYKPFMTLLVNTAQPTLDIYSDYILRFGPIVTGQVIHIAAKIYNLTGKAPATYAGSELSSKVL